MKTIEIQAKQWRDKVNGNSYFSAKMYVDFGLESEQTFVLPFQYGYGEQYRHASLELLKQQGKLQDGTWQELQAKGIKLLARIEKDCKKLDVKAFGKLIE
jgi:hypothetical protein